MHPSLRQGQPETFESARPTNPKFSDAVEWSGGIDGSWKIGLYFAEDGSLWLTQDHHLGVSKVFLNPDDAKRLAEEILKRCGCE